MKFIVTGATGYIGTHVVRGLLRGDHTVFALSRTRPNDTQARWVPFNLSRSSDEISKLVFAVDGIIHLAATTSQVNKHNDYPDIDAAKYLISLAKRANCKFVFISSQTAQADSPTDYGRIKWIIENEVIAARGFIIRPGQVYGGEARGLFGTMVRLVNKMPLLPAFRPEPQMQPIHVDDLTEAIVKVAEEASDGPDILCLGAPEPVGLTTFLTTIAVDRLRCRRLFLPMPSAPITSFAKFFPGLAKSNLYLNRLNSLFNLSAMETTEAIRKTGICLRPLHWGMHPSGYGRRRHIMVEGRALLKYILKRDPRKWSLRRYVQAIEKLDDGRPLNLPRFFLNFPTFLALIDAKSSDPNSIYERLALRLDFATNIAEATPLGARCFLAIGLEFNSIAVYIVLLKAIVFEILFRSLRFFLCGIINSALKKAHIA